MNTQSRYALSLFSLTMITVGSVDSIRNLPATAIFGSQLISFFILGALFFLLPTALVSAELASGWPKQGGIYVWVKEAFGKNMGFLAIWLQWVENVFYYPVLLMFLAGSPTSRKISVIDKILRYKNFLHKSSKPPRPLR